MFVEVADLDVGDRFTLVDPLGLIHQPVTIVGVGVTPNDFTFAAGAPIAYPTDGFSLRWARELQGLFDGGTTEVLGPGVLVAGDGGLERQQLLARLVESLPSDAITGVNEASAAAVLVVDTLDLQRSGYLALAVVGGAAVLGILALVLVRIARLQPGEQEALSALGCTSAQLRTAVVIPSALVAVIAGAGAVFLAALLGGAVPTGLAQRVGAGRRRATTRPSWPWAGSAPGGPARRRGLGGAAGAPGDRGIRLTGRRSKAWRWPAVGAGLRAATGGLASAGRWQAMTAGRRRRDRRPGHRRPGRGRAVSDALRQHPHGSASSSTCGSMPMRMRPWPPPIATRW